MEWDHLLYLYSTILIRIDNTQTLNMQEEEFLELWSKIGREHSSGMQQDCFKR